MENNEDSQLDSSTHARASEARNRKKKDAEDIGINADYISAFVDRFYTRIQNDDMLGPIFAARVGNWPEHLARMKQFWRSVLHNSGEFSGNPMLKHMRIPGLNRTHFDHWLDLFEQTLRELETHPEATKHVSARARLIADSLLGGIQSHNNGLNIIARVPAPKTKPWEAPQAMQQEGLQEGFQLPGQIWASMIVSYGIFFAAVAVAMRHTGEALFVIAIAVCYALIFFGGVAVISRIGGREKPSPLRQPHGELQTLSGPLNAKEVAAQVLVIPACIACFSIIALIVRLNIGH